VQVGFAQQKITPPLGTVLGGQLHPNHAEAVESDLYARAMAIRDGEMTALLISCDVLLFSNELADVIRREIAALLPIPLEQVILAATHTHSGPSLDTLLGVEADVAYLDALPALIADAARAAYGNLAEAHLFTSRATAEGLAFNRRGVMADGSVQTHPLKKDPHLIGLEGPTDPEVGILYACDVNGQFLGGLVNFACHGTVMSRYSTAISADYMGQACRHFAALMQPEAVVLFVNGACGNICQVNALDPTTREVGPAWAKHMGARIALAAAAAIRRGDVSPVSTLRVDAATLTLPRRRIPVAMVEQALARSRRPLPVGDVRLSDYGVESFDTLPPSMLSLEELFRSPLWESFGAAELLAIHAEYQHSPVMELPIGLITGGDFALITVPCELFTEWGLEIKARSPYAYTFIAELCNGYAGYVPTESAFMREGGYETKLLSTSKLDIAAGRLITEHIVDRLRASRRP
jgi:hypothetical protein